MPSLDPLGVIIVVMVVLLFLSFRLSAYLLKRAICIVIDVFRQNIALRPENAMTLEELGLSPPPFLSLRLLRDYKPYALQILFKNSLVRSTPDGRYYLVEENPEMASVLRCPANAARRHMKSLNRAAMPGLFSWRGEPAGKRKG